MTYQKPNSLRLVLFPLIVFIYPLLCLLPLVLNAAQPDPEVVRVLQQLSDETIRLEQSVRKEFDRTSPENVTFKDPDPAITEDAQGVMRAEEHPEATKKKGRQQAWKDSRGWIGQHPLISFLILMFFIGLVDLLLSGQLVRLRWWVITSALLVATGAIIYEQQGFWNPSSSENRVTLPASDETQARATSANNFSQRKDEDIHTPQRPILPNAQAQGEPPTGHATGGGLDTLKGRSHSEEEKGPYLDHVGSLNQKEPVLMSSHTRIPWSKLPFREIAAGTEEAIAKQAIVKKGLPFAYTIHLESFSNPQAALQRIRYLHSLGLEAFSHRVVLPGKGTFYHVFIGRFANRSEAQSFQGRLENEYNLGRGLIMSASAAIP